MNEVIEPLVVSPMQHEDELIVLKPVASAEETGHTVSASTQAVKNHYQQSIAQTDTVAADTIPAAKDLQGVPGEELQGIVLVNPAAEYVAVTGNGKDTSPVGEGMSWIYLVLGVLFCITALKFKGSTRYLHAIASDMTDTRVRHNAFDDTVKETSLMVLLNLMWVASAGIMLWVGVDYYVPSDSTVDSIGISCTPPAGICRCAAIAALYLCVMLIAYWIVGLVFSDSRQTRLWVKGAAASTGLQAFVLFPLALVALNYPQWSQGLIIIGIIVFVIGKLVFLFQGFRIFFAQLSSWMLFLYYLCSLEIIPVIITCFAAVSVCTSR